jgi:hypothetical protein
MSNRRSNKMRKNPFVRFLRIVYRSFKIIFRKKPDPRIFEERRRALEALDAQKAREEQLAREAAARQRELERQQQELATREKDQFMTVGELLEKIKWQLPKEKVAEVNARPEYDVSLN